jgi:hypothetical protein
MARPGFARAAGHRRMARAELGASDMIGEQVGVGVTGEIIGAVLTGSEFRHDEQRRAVILVDTGRSTSRYVTALVSLTSSGRVCGREWDAGVYHNDRDSAAKDMVQRASVAL